MKSLLIILLFITTTSYSQNLLLIPKDTIQINLHLTEIKRLNTTSHLLFAAGVVSTIVLYNIEPKTPMMFIVPLSFCLTGMGIHMYQSHLENKYHHYTNDEFSVK